MTTDAQHVIRTINRAEDAHFILTGMARHQRTGRDSLGVDTSPDPSVPLNLTMHDLAQDIGTILRELALDVADAAGDWPDGLDAPGAALFVRQRAEVVVGHEGRETTLHALEDLYRKATGALGMLPRRTRIPEHCECGHEQWVYHENVAFTRCAGGHVSSLADHAYMENAPDFSATQAARLMGVTRWTITRMLERGDLVGAKGSPGTPARVSAMSISAWTAGRVAS